MLVTGGLHRLTFWPGRDLSSESLELGQQKDLGLRVYGLGLRTLGCKDLGFREVGLGLKALGLGFKA